MSRAVARVREHRLHGEGRRRCVPWLVARLTGAGCPRASAPCGGHRSRHREVAKNLKALCAHDSGRRRTNRPAEAVPASVSLSVSLELLPAGRRGCRSARRRLYGASETLCHEKREPAAIGRRVVLQNDATAVPSCRKARSTAVIAARGESPYSVRSFGPVTDDLKRSWLDGWVRLSHYVRIVDAQNSGSSRGKLAVTTAGRRVGKSARPQGPHALQKILDV